MMIRDFQPDDADAVNALALAAFSQYQSEYTDWEGFSRNIRTMSLLAAAGELIVAEEDEKVCGAVAYIGPDLPKADFFRPDWTIIRMLVVDPNRRGQGVGRRLTEECIRRAARDQAKTIALHTSPIMAVALSMYVRMGFMYVAEAPAIHGVPYGIYTRSQRSGV